MKRLALIVFVALTACRDEQAATPPPADLTEASVGYFCRMILTEHAGPKGQIHLAGQDAPLFFGQVRDLMAYLKGPEREAEITAIYVSDMGRAESWAEPGRSNWIEAKSAVFVVGAGVAGGMGAPEIVPFADRAAAATFIAIYGGTAVPLDQIPDDAALAPVDPAQELETPV